ncbi:hypothetical protein N9329_00495 [Gammaproteobacteria bacterium]|nr:hypothetical protein [Gammaproteobacteria bacterium]HAS48759.1 hypothetical protein [Gammaproteobacteria bacterium]
MRADYATIAFFKMDEAFVTREFAEKIYLAESGNETRRQYCDYCNTMMFDCSEGFPHPLGVMSDQLQHPFKSSPSCYVYVRKKKPGMEILAGMKLHEARLS